MLTLFCTFLRLFFSRKKTHLLLLLQNNYELRGSGGFITQLVDVAIGGLQVKMVFRNDQEELRPKAFIPAPKEIQQYLGHDHWFLRDTNIFGNFSTSAKHVIHNYQSLFPDHEVAGVFSLNFSAVEDLIGMLGAVKFQKKILNQNNLFREISGQVSNVDLHDKIQLQKRKNILRPLAIKLLSSALFRFWKWPKLVRLFHAMLKRKDFQIYWDDASRRAFYLKKNIVESEFLPVDRDFLQVVENNYLGLKSNRYIRRNIRRKVSLGYDPDSLQLHHGKVHTRITWDHLGGDDYPFSGTYQAVVQVHLPLTAKELVIHSPQHETEISRDNVSTIITLHHSIKVQESGVLEFSYDIGNEIVHDNSYSFQFIKQSGVRNEHVQQAVQFPQHFAVISAGDGRVADELVFENRTDVQENYSTVYSAQLDLSPPRILLHEMVGPGIFEITFHEPVWMNDDFAVLVESQDGTREFPVTKVFKGKDHRRLLLHVSDIPDIEEKFYRITLTGIENAVHAVMHNRTITSVYRSRFFRKNL
ncbi:MAG: DUF4012 domain-containing protein [Candidatus Gracilibacteria bacterium]